MTEKYLKQLKIISIVYYVFAALGALASIGIAGLTMLLLSNTMGFTTAIIASAVIGFTSLGLVYVFQFLMAQNIAKQKHPLFCTVVSVISLLSIPFGTAVGIWTLVLLNKPEVKALFNTKADSFASSGMPMDVSYESSEYNNSQPAEENMPAVFNNDENTPMPEMTLKTEESVFEMISSVEEPVIKAEYIAPPVSKNKPSKNNNNSQQYSPMFSNENNPWLKHSKENK